METTGFLAKEKGSVAAQICSCLGLKYYPLLAINPPPQCIRLSDTNQNVSLPRKFLMVKVVTERLNTADL